MSRFVVTVVTIVLGGAAGVSADPIIVINTDARLAVTLSTFPSENTSEQRVVEARAGDRLVATDAAPPPVGFRTSAAATLTSTVAEPLHWSGLSATDASLSDGFGSTSADAIFSVVFDVAAPVDYVFNGTGSLSASLATLNNTFAFADNTAFGALARIVVPGEDPILQGVFGFQEFVLPLLDDGSYSRAFSRQFAGVLAPGQYWLQWAAGAGVGRSQPNPGSAHAMSAFAFTFDLAPRSTSPTPEPASLLLLGTGIAGVFGTRSRRNRR